MNVVIVFGKQNFLSNCAGGTANTKMVLIIINTVFYRCYKIRTSKMDSRFLADWSDYVHSFMMVEFHPQTIRERHYVVQILTGV
jgi:hypothetical protein